MNWPRFERATDPDAYVNRVLINTFPSTRRRRWTGERPVARVPDEPAPDSTGQVDDADALLRALELLPSDQRVAVVLRYYAMLTEAQMATALDVAPGTVKSRLSRAFRALAADPNLRALRGP